MRLYGKRKRGWKKCKRGGEIGKDRERVRKRKKVRKTERERRRERMR